MTDDEAADAGGSTPADATDDATAGTDGSTPAAEADGGTAAVAAGEEIDYLEREVNLFRPSTPFMRDNLKMIFTLFGVWVVFVFGPVTASLFAEEFMTETTVLGGFPLNFFLTAIVAPLAALVLAAIYAWYRDRLDRKYGITHGSGEDAGETGAEGATADGGEPS